MFGFEQVLVCGEIVTIPTAGFIAMLTIKQRHEWKLKMLKADVDRTADDRLKVQNQVTFASIQLKRIEAENALTQKKLQLALEEATTIQARLALPAPPKEIVVTKEVQVPVYIEREKPRRDNELEAVLSEKLNRKMATYYGHQGRSNIIHLDSNNKYHPSMKLEHTGWMGEK